LGEGGGKEAGFPYLAQAGLKLKKITCLNLQVLSLQMCFTTSGMVLLTCSLYLSFFLFAVLGTELSSALARQVLYY
jgi:hypothetical protein